MTENERMITDLDMVERAFFKIDLLSTTYFKKQREHYIDTRLTIFNNPLRNYPALLNGLTLIHEHRQDHARSFVKRFREQQNDFNSCEAVFAELIVYGGCLRQLWEGHLTGLDLQPDSHDLELTRPDGTHAFLEVLCVMLDPVPDASGLVTYQTHKQDPNSSIRQKLFQKIERGQLSKPRENWAVIELNHSAMTSFAVLSSLSSGYKIGPDAEGYDWRNSFFHDPRTRSIRGIVYFFMGLYGGRSVLHNPFWHVESEFRTVSPQT
jgi:hypothetical protein